MTDSEALRFYDAAAKRLGDRLPDAPPSLAAFAAALPAGATILDLGCGHGVAAAHLAKAGFDVTGLDPSGGLLAVARKLAPTAHFRVGGFDDLPGMGPYDAIWCHFALLHAPRARMPRHLAAMAQALTPDGTLALAMLEGEGEIRDPRGLPYTFVTETFITALLSEAGFRDINATRAPAPAGVAGRDIALHLRATRARAVDPGAV
ncbi:class I SAM-dependent methyltransferase [Rhodobacter sp. NTK016B]|uniref:class I SAM-dependent methyltransferase n=1 Tax=Rhodobacter sp. NTK016B TaxID=2759676 RepID=UPI001A8D9015|nr:class I SAM-dependent methyltransferase [Rhodobacter sp. NTK016B]